MAKISISSEREPAQPGIIGRSVERLRDYVGFFRTRFRQKVQKVLGRQPEEVRIGTVQDLEKLKSLERLTKNSHVAYVGCGNDVSVSKVFPECINIDIEEDLKEHVKHFIKGDALNLPLLNESLDLAVQQAMVYSVDSHPQAPSELVRVLKPGGKVLRNFPNLETPKHLHEALKNIHYLLVLQNYAVNGLVMKERLSEENVLFEKGPVDQTKIHEISKQIEAAQVDFFEVLSRQNLEQFQHEDESPFLYGRYAYHRAFEFVLGVDLQASEDIFTAQLRRLQPALSPNEFRKVQCMASTLKKGWDATRRKFDLALK